MRLEKKNDKLRNRGIDKPISQQLAVISRQSNKTAESRKLEAGRTVLSHQSADEQQKQLEAGRTVLSWQTNNLKQKEQKQPET